MGVDVLVLNTAVADFRSGEFAFADELMLKAVISGRMYGPGSGK